MGIYKSWADGSTIGNKSLINFSLGWKQRSASILIFNK